MKFGRLFFALSLFCFIALIGLSFYSITDAVEDDDFHRVGSEHEIEFESDVTIFGEEADLVDFFFLLLAYALAAIIPTFIKFVAAGFTKERVIIVSMVFDVIFTLFGAAVAIDIFLDGIPINPLTLWAIAATVLPGLSFFFNLLGLRRKKRDIMWG